MKRIVLALVAGVVLFSSTAEAYVLPGHFILKMLADKRRDQGIEDLSVQLSREDAEGETVDAHLYLRAPGQMRWVLDTDPATIFVDNGSKRAQGKEGKLEPVKGVPTDLTALFMAPGPQLDVAYQKMKAALTKLGVSLDESALGRDGRNIVYIIGARGFESDKPQLWIDKGTFLPVKLKAKVPGSETMFEMRYRDYGSAAGGNWFPGVIEYYEGDKLVWRAETLQVDRNNKLPDSLFETR